MKNILVLSPTPSHPQDAGNRKRIFALTKYLQELGATIYFVYCPREWDREIPKAAYDGMNQCWDYFFVAYPVQPAVHQTDNEYFELDAWWDVGIEFSINWIKLAADIDLVLCNYVFYSKVLELFDEQVTKVIDTHDITSNRNYLLDKKLGYRDFFYISPESEKKALNRAHLVLSIKEDESSWFKCLSSTPVLTIGHLEPEPSTIVERTIDYQNIKLGFIGSANPINVKNLESFLDEYLALDSKYTENLTFVVGGKVCNVLSDRFHDQVEIIGMVEDVSEFYEQVDIIILPFEFSTGLKIKTVEALSWSKPCMGTVNAFEGLGSSCKFHNYLTIEELATSMKDLNSDTQDFIYQLEADSKTVFTNYSNQVKQSIRKLYNFDWKSVKELQATPSITSEITEITSDRLKTYNFNIITNVNFWNTYTNESAWINWWINNASKLGNINIYRTDSFKNIDADKLELYKLGLVNNVHYRELYQIVDLFKITPDENQIFINILDFSSIIYNQLCLEELDSLHLANNHYLWYFCCNRNNRQNDQILEYISQVCDRKHQKQVGFYWGNLNLPQVANADMKNQNILLLKNPVFSSRPQPGNLNLNQITIVTSCLNATSIKELDKLVRCCHDFLPNNFELLIISDLEIVTKEYDNVQSLRNTQTILPQIDIFICIEEPQFISFLIYLCIANSIPVYYKKNQYFDILAEEDMIKPMDNFTAIPEVYKLFLESSILRQKIYPSAIYHQSWELFVEYLIDLLSPGNTYDEVENYSTIN